MRMTPEGIQSLVDKKIYERGLEYYADGRVTDCLLKNGILFAKVRGSLPEPYQVKVFFTGKIKPHCECSCLYDWGATCKHAVAALLYVSRGPLKQRKVPWVKNEKSLLFSDDEIIIAPILRFILPARQNFGISSKGIKMEMLIVQDDRPPVAADPWDLVYSRSYRGDSAQYPPIQSFSLPQQYCLRLLAAFSKDEYDEPRIEPFELSLLFMESAGVEGIQFFEGRNRQLQIRGDQKAGVTVEIAHKNAKFTQAYFHVRRPGESERLMEGGLVAGRPCWMIDFEGGNIFPFDEVFRTFIDQGIRGLIMPLKSRGLSIQPLPVLCLKRSKKKATWFFVIKN